MLGEWLTTVVVAWEMVNGWLIVMGFTCFHMVCIVWLMPFHKQDVPTIIGKYTNIYGGEWVFGHGCSKHGGHADHSNCGHGRFMVAGVLGL